MRLSWTVRRLSGLASRLGSSVATRGWGGTFRYWQALRRTAVAVNQTADAPGIKGPDDHAKRLLVIESRTPDPTRDSGSVRLCRIFDLLCTQGWRIYFLADRRDGTPESDRRLAALGVHVVHESAPKWLASQGDSLDAVMLCRLPIATQYFDLVTGCAARARVVFDTVDLHFVREMRGAEVTGNDTLRRRAMKSRTRELELIAKCSATLVVSEEERAAISRELPDATVEVVSNIHDVSAPGPGVNARSGLLFVGGFGHPPNEDAVRWFITNVQPRLKNNARANTLRVVGEVDPKTRQQLASEKVVFHGRVNDLTDLHNASLASVAPLRFGAGVKGKVNQAMSLGLPVVLTSIAAEGMHLIDGNNALIADTDEAMAAALQRLERDEVLWLKLSEAGMANVRQHFSAEKALPALRRALEDAR